MLTPKEAKELSASNREKIVAKETERILAILSKLFTQALDKGKFIIKTSSELDLDYFEDIKRNIIVYYKGYNISISKDNEDNAMSIYIYW